MKSYSSREIIKIIEKDGWEFSRCNGDHRIFKHPAKKGIVVVVHPEKDVKKGTFKSIMRQAQITLDE